METPSIMKQIKIACPYLKKKLEGFHHVIKLIKMNP